MKLIQDYFKVCPVCERQYEANRLNQTYCTTLCKARYNNHKAKNNKLNYNAITEKKNKILWKNRGILEMFEGQELNIDILKKMGFKLNYVTNFSLNKKLEKNVLVVYDFAYIFLDEKIIKIKRYE